MLGKLSDIEVGKKWTKTLSEIEFAFNNLVHITTGESPSILLFGIPQRGKVHDPIAEFLINDVNCEKRNLKEIRDKASKKMIEKRNQVIAQANKKRKGAVVYKVDDYVMIKNYDNTVGISPKVIPQFKGPYQVTKVLRNNRYVIADIPGFQVTQKKYEGVWEPANMRLWRKNISPLNN
ncbi:uncharacterized protein LOC117180495 [Belonocnema kinseyi]|uniref:uncharacterized protein LOC117180495 n=1 Tax=Belonocnema kinseyi TaxID=2817044 RepID=UPI00143DA545|nr:uncharacterized protein LOC117180495 [Belonocnema kinseyi]